MYQVVSLKMQGHFFITRHSIYDTFKYEAIRTVNQRCDITV